MSEYVVNLEGELGMALAVACAGAGFAREKIVRCRDCGHYYETDEYHPKGNYVRRCCQYFNAYSDEVSPDGFCAWGIRKEMG